MNIFYSICLSDPLKWSPGHVKQWLKWAILQFGLKNINKSQWNMNGEELFSLNQVEFRRLVPTDLGDTFYMHFELLRKTHVVGNYIEYIEIVFIWRQSNYESYYTLINRNIA